MQTRTLLCRLHRSTSRPKTLLRRLPMKTCRVQGREVARRCRFPQPSMAHRGRWTGLRWMRAVPPRPPPLGPTVAQTGSTAHWSTLVRSTCSHRCGGRIQRHASVSPAGGRCASTHKQAHATLQCNPETKRRSCMAYSGLLRAIWALPMALCVGMLGPGKKSRGPLYAR